MGDKRDRKEPPAKTKTGQDRNVRLEQALRANLLKRKAKAKVVKAEAPSEEGGQG
jgi:hypothetical protein